MSFNHFDFFINKKTKQVYCLTCERFPVTTEEFLSGKDPDPHYVLNYKIRNREEQDTVQYKEFEKDFELTTVDVYYDFISGAFSDFGLTVKNIVNGSFIVERIDYFYLCKGELITEELDTFFSHLISWSRVLEQVNSLEKFDFEKYKKVKAYFSAYFEDNNIKNIVDLEKRVIKLIKNE